MAPTRPLGRLYTKIRANISFQKRSILRTVAARARRGHTSSLFLCVFRVLRFGPGPVPHAPHPKSDRLEAKQLSMCLLSNGNRGTKTKAKRRVSCKLGLKETAGPTAGKSPPRPSTKGGAGVGVLCHLHVEGEEE